MSSPLLFALAVLGPVLLVVGGYALNASKPPDGGTSTASSARTRTDPF